MDALHNNATVNKIHFILKLKYILSSYTVKELQAAFVHILAIKSTKKSCFCVNTREHGRTEKSISLTVS